MTNFLKGWRTPSRWREAKRKRPLSLRQGNKRCGGGCIQSWVWRTFFLSSWQRSPWHFSFSFLRPCLPEGKKEDEKTHRKCKWSLLTCDFCVTMASGMWLNVHFLSKQVRELCTALKECIVCVCTVLKGIRLMWGLRWEEEDTRKCERDYEISYFLFPQCWWLMEDSQSYWGVLFVLFCFSKPILFFFYHSMCGVFQQWWWLQ